MNIVFIGTTRFGLRCAEALARIPECRLVGAVAAPPTFSISYRPEGVRNVLHGDVPAFCGRMGVPILLLADGMKGKEALAQVRAWEPDAFVVAGWYHMVPKAWREVAPAYGLHASLLPDYSGGAPLVWAMINGERRTGITLFQLADGIDDGPVVGRAETEILAEDTIATLYARVEDLGVKLLVEHMPRLAAGTAAMEPQDDRRRRTFPQRSPADGRIDWSWPAERIRNFVRAQTRPYPGAFTKLEGRRLTIWSVGETQDAPANLACGRYACDGGRLFAGTGDGGALELLDLALEGGDLPPSGFCAGRPGAGRFDAAEPRP